LAGLTAAARAARAARCSLSPHRNGIFVAEKPHLIAGSVVDAVGNPVPSARVYFMESPVALPDIAAMADARGRFTLSVPSEGAYTIESAAEGHGTGRATVDVTRDGQAEVQIRLT
jgi:hypothetical protein